MIPRIFALLVTGTFLLCGAHVACAQDDGPTETSLTDSEAARETASTHFRRGVELFQETHYRAALIEFERAYETLPDFRLHYNIAQTKRLLQDYIGAVQSYERYLADGGTAVPEERRAEVREQLTHLRERIAHLTITSNAQSVRIFVDDQPVGVTPITTPVAVNVGRHTVTARASDGQESSEVVDVAGGDNRAVYLPIEAAEPQPAQAVAPAEANEPATETSARSGAQRFALAAIVMGGSAVLGGVGAGVVAAVEQKNFDEARSEDMLGAADKHSTRTERAALATDVLVSVGLALAVTGIVTWVLKSPSRESSGATSNRREVRLGLGAGTLNLQGAF